MSLKRKRAAGFSLLELLISLVVFLVISGAVMSGMFSFQKGHRSQEIRVALEERMRATVELMSQEIGQAGLPASGVDQDGMAIPLATLTTYSPNTPSNGYSTITVTPSGSGITTLAGVIPGEMLTVDSSTPQERVQVYSVSGNTVVFTGTFANSHTLNTAAIWAPGTYPGGILYPTPAGTANGWPYPTNYSSTLYMFGDLNAVGYSAVLAKYACPATYPGAFTRQRFDVLSGAALDAGVTLVDNVTYCSFKYICASPGSSPMDCASTTPQPNPVLIPLGGVQQPYLMVVGVGFSITAQSQTKDPTTGQIVTLSKTFLNIQPRNIVAANHEQTFATPDQLEVLPYDRTKGVFAKIAAGQI